MNINRQNYESIMVDYLDGRLSPEDEAELMLFLLKNPDIAEELEGLQDASLNPSKIHYPNKSVLKKQAVQPFGINNEIDYLCIAELEGDITEKERKQLSRLIENDESIRHIQTVFTSTKLTVPYEIVYPNKSSIKRMRVIPIRRTTYRIAMSIAATVTIMFAVYTTIDLNLRPEFVAESKNITPVTIQNKENLKSSPAEKIQPFATEKQISRRDVAEVNSRKKIESTGLDKNTREEIKIEKIQTIPASINQIARVEPDKIALPKSTKAISTTDAINYTSRTQPTGSTKEYSIADLAQIGIKRVANTFGIEYNIQKNDNGKVEKLSIESNLLAFSTTRVKNNE